MSSPRSRVRLAITQGDPHGIGPEILLKALAQGAASEADLRILGDPVQLAKTASKLGVAPPSRVDRAPHSGARIAFWALEEACRLAAAGEVDAIVTAPVHKADLVRIGFPHPGQTEFLGDRLGGTPTMMLAGEELRVGLVTTHLPVREVADAITTERVVDTIRRTRRGLALYFGIESPRIAVLGLNPHAGEDGVLGHEDAEFIGPAVAACREEGIDCVGPLPADAAFAPRSRARFDAHVAMFHDQGLTALKAVEGGRAINLTLGLPVPRTSPDHGTARDIFGRGVADPTSMIAALELACSAAARWPR